MNGREVGQEGVRVQGNFKVMQLNVYFLVYLLESVLIGNDFDVHLLTFMRNSVL